MLSVNQQDINLGKLKFGVTHHFKYILMNEGSDPLSINKIIVGCDKCTTATIRDTYLSPGATSDLNVAFIPGSKGMNLKSVSVMYGADNKELKLKFRASVDG